MKIKLLLISLLTFMFLTSCDDTESFDSQWRNENEAQFVKIMNDSRYTKLNSLSNNGFIMYQVIESGDGVRFPYFTEKVKINYEGWFKRIWTSPDEYEDEKGQFIQNKQIFDSTKSSRSSDHLPRTFPVNGLVAGFSTALQHMKEGDKWEVWIPWNLGYGPLGSGSIPEYTTLVFEIELLEIVEE